MSQLNKEVQGFFSRARLWTSVILLLNAANAQGQAVPADLLDMSIDELLSADVSESDSAATQSSRPWTLSYSYHFSKFDEYLDDSKRVPVDDVLFSPGEEPRTDKNFPVVPTEIEQEIHSLVLSYDVRADFSLSVSIPYIKQSTDHVSIIPGYSAFNISSEGLGDVSVVGNYRFRQSISGHWQAGLGVSFPTGSIDEEGDTPRARGDQQLPYSMQLGSGTYDVPAYIAYRGNEYAFDWGVGLSGKLRLGENDRDYSLGNRVSAVTWLRLTTIGLVQPSIKLNYRYWGDIDGEDKSLTVPGPFPYPAPVVDPSLFGGDMASVALGLRVPVMSPYRYVDVEFAKPIYQSLNGPQSSEDYRFSISLSLEF